ncbi:RibD family protein [Thalassobaculum sp.]|uniref:RibD family protein n=1 Tax=Thalassobaculum sp. TaxID=2022740 RepID=UPI003B5A51E0
MSITWETIRETMLHARQVRRLDGDARPLIAEIGRMREEGSDIPGATALLDLVEAATRGRVAIGQSGQTLDGRIATQRGHSHYVNGPEALDHLHRLRALADAVIVGSGTLRADDPSLTVRRCAGENPTRVVLSGNGTVPQDRKLFTDELAPTMVTGVDLPCEPDENGIVDPRGVLDSLSAIGLDVVLVEGGAATLSHFLRARCLDRLHVMVAPTILGSGRQGVMLEEVETMGDALRFSSARYDLGADTLFDLVPQR